MKTKAILWAGLLLVGCSGQGTFDNVANGTASDKDIVINEVMPKGSSIANEFGETADWLELYNNSNTTITLDAGQWFLTDDPNDDPTKYELPELELKPNEHVLIWCDDENIVSNDIHTNFKLSSDGETVVLYHRKGRGDAQVIDVCTYEAITEGGNSIARVKDGSATWSQKALPTPLVAN